MHGLATTLHILLLLRRLQQNAARIVALPGVSVFE